MEYGYQWAMAGLALLALMNKNIQLIDFLKMSKFGRIRRFKFDS
jgi:hypothetical protein